MASRYGGITGSKKISEDFENINIAFENVERDMDEKSGKIDQHIANNDIHVNAVKKQEWDSKAPGITKDQLDAHVSNESIHLSGEESAKLASIENGAQPNQNAFSRVNGMTAASPSDSFTIVGDAGIVVTQNPNDKSVHLTVTGTSAPGSHAATHLTGGSDPIPTATETTSGLMSPDDKKAMNSLKASIDRVDLSAALMSGTSVITTTQASDIDLTAYGQTRKNIVNSDGNFETDSNNDGVADGWAAVLYGAAASLETTGAKYGLKAQRITAKTTDANVARRIEKANIEVESGKCYVFLSDLLTDGNAPGHIVTANNTASGANATSNISSSNKVHFVKIKPTSSGTVYLRLYNDTPVGQVGWVQFDGAGFYEVPESLYNRIGVDITEANIREYLPHVDGRQHVNGVVVTKQGKNLLPPFTEWNLHANAKIIGPYELELTATSTALQHSTFEFPCLPSQAYTYTLEHNGSIQAYSYDASGVGTQVLVLSSGPQYTFMTPANAVRLRVYVTSRAVGSFTFKNPMLTLGSVATPFEPAEIQRLILPVTLASTPDGNVRDIVYYREGEWRLMKRVDTSVDPAVALATPVESVIRNVEGGISLHPGGNQISVETGVIQREKVTFDPATKRATTSKRSSRILGVYKGAADEPFVTYTSSGQTLPQLVDAVESGKDYYVTYMAMDKYSLTANVTQMNAAYTSGLSASVDDALRNTARLTMETDQLEFAVDYAEAKADNLRVDFNEEIAHTLKKGNLFSTLYGNAIQESSVQPNGSLSKIIESLKTGVANIVFWGDSITEGLDNISPMDTYVSKFIDAMQKKFPKATINYANYSIAGATSGNAANPNYVAGTNFTRPWGVAGKSWRDHVKDFSPDLVVIAFGMNDAVSNNGDATIKTNYDSITAYMNTWSKVPNVAFVTSLMSTLDTSIYSVTQANLVAVNRSIRAYAVNGGYALADANRLSRILRDGVDEVSRVHTSEVNWSGYNTNWDGDKASFTLSGATLTPAAGVTNKFIRRTRNIYNGFMEFDVVPVDVGAQGWIVIEYRKSDTGYMALVIHPGNSGAGIAAFYVDALSTPVSSKTNLTIVPGTSYKIRLEFYGTRHTVYINGESTLSFNTHENMQDGFIRMGGINKLATFSNLNIGFCDSLTTPGQFTDEQLLGPYNDPASGNGVNHPSALGTSIIYAPAMLGIVQEASKHVQKTGVFLPIRLLKSEFSAPGSGYPTTTDAGEKLYFKTVNKYDKSNGLALRRIDNGAYYTLSTKAVSDATLNLLEPGSFAYYKVNATLDFVWISVPSDGPVPSDMDLYQMV